MKPLLKPLEVAIIRLPLLAVALSLAIAALVPQQAVAHDEPVCAYCKYCFDPEKTELNEEEPTNHLVLGLHTAFNCGPGDQAVCSELTECPEDPSPEEAPIEESELLALVSSGAMADLKNFIESHPEQIGVVLDRNLILIRERRGCVRKIVGVYEVAGLRAALQE